MSISRKWLVCFGCFLIHFTIFGIHSSYGLLYSELVERFNQPQMETALIGSISISLTFLVGPLSQVLISYVGFKITMVIATLLCVVGLISASFVIENTALLVATYSVLWGTGTGFANHAGLVVLQEHFGKQLSLANGIATSGSGIGAFVVGPLVNLILNKYSVAWLMRTLALLPLLFIFSILVDLRKKASLEFTSFEQTVGNKDSEDIKLRISSSTNNPFNKISEIEYPSPLFVEACSSGSRCINDSNDDTITESEGRDGIQNTSNLLLSPVGNRKHSSEQRTSLKEIFNKKLWTYKAYLILITGVCIFYFGYPIPFIFLIHHVIKQGIPKHQAQYLLGTLAIVSVALKIISGIFLNYQNIISRSGLFSFSMFIISFAQLLVIFGNQYWHYILYAVVYGFSEGIFIGQLAAVTVDTVPSKDLIGLGIGNLFAIIAIPIMIGPIIAGQLSTAIGFNNVPFIFAFVLCLLGSTMTTMVKMFNKQKTLTVTIDPDINTTATRLCVLEKPIILVEIDTAVFDKKHFLTFSGFHRSENYRTKKQCQENR